jgi:hypothetical protein
MKLEQFEKLVARINPWRDEESKRYTHRVGCPFAIRYIEGGTTDARRMFWHVMLTLEYFTADTGRLCVDSDGLRGYSFGEGDTLEAALDDFVNKYVLQLKERQEHAREKAKKMSDEAAEQLRAVEEILGEPKQ